MKDQFLKIDGVSLNATAFSKMSESEALAEMTNGNILKTHGKDAAWGKKAHQACVNALRPQKPKAVRQKDVELDN